MFGTAPSDRTVVVLLHKHFSSQLSTSCNSISIITNCTYANTRKCNIMPYVNNSFTFSSCHDMSNFSSTQTVFHQFFSWTALGDIHLRFSLILVTKANAVEEETT
jgi:hypothetical protein